MSVPLFEEILMSNRLPWLVIAVRVLAGIACSLASRDAPPRPGRRCACLVCPCRPTLPTPLHLCPVQWFFMFVKGESDPLGTCPGAVIQVSAAGQDFEGGRAYWYAAPPGASDPRGTVWIIYNSGEWLTYPDTWQPGEMESDPGIAPPGGRYQPVQRTGKVWRENADVRQRLGWVYTPPQPFNGRMQEPTGDSAAWAGHSHYWYLDHGAWGIVLRVYAVDMGPNLWEVAGRY